MMALKGHLAKVLRRKKTVVTRAFFWKIPHDTREDEIRLKIGRYKWSIDLPEDEVLESIEPKSELTLDEEELHALVAFLQENYEPFKQGVKAFLPLDRPFEQTSAQQIRALFSLPRKRELVEFILNNDVIPEELAAGLRQARRARAVRQFESMLEGDLPEGTWQRWFQANSWVLGSQFVRIVDERQIDTAHISDFLMEGYDGFLDVVEIKKPAVRLPFWATSLDHGNYIPSADLTKAITQASRYVFEVEREANSIKFLERVGGVRAVKPRGILVFGRSKDWNDAQAEAYRILNAGFHNLTVLTYDHVFARARRLCGMV